MTGSSSLKGNADRPRRGSPEQTRARLVQTAAEIFNRLGYHGTDSNQIAHQAGYSTGTFYKHFKDKKEIFLTVYEHWVTEQWNAILGAIEAGRTPRDIAREVVRISIDFRTKGRTLRSSLQVLVSSDPDVRRFYRTQRRRQLDTMSRIRKKIGATPQTREEDAIHLYTTERVFDAIANGELAPLGLDRNAVIEQMVGKVQALLGYNSAPPELPRRRTLGSTTLQ
ncbi:TetR/AcrR family transcriptional regulator [Acidobacteria bacterium AB60]|nr:TetR/AcrR family transcriptional regulator [Acidobacteria bacterium AB60]